MSLLNLPAELLVEILILCDPVEVSKVAQTCQYFRELVYGVDDTLWRGLYLAELIDDPRQCVGPDGRPRPHVNWRVELQRTVRARNLITSNSIGGLGEIGTIIQTLLNLASYVPVLSRADLDSSIARTLVWIPAQMFHTGWLDLVEKQSLATHERQMAAKFHTLFGLTPHDLLPEALVASRALVYNMHNYSWKNDYGPFMEDGSIDWVHVRAIHHVVSMQVILEGGELEAYETNQEKPAFIFYRMSLPYTQITAPNAEVSLDTSSQQDWVGITGDWLVSFCFCDHRELLKYNQGISSPGVPEDTSIFESEDFFEVFRSMTAELKVLRTEPGGAVHLDKPVIFFTGVMKDINQSTMNGKVWMSSDGSVRWEFCSGEEGNAIWSSIGVQIGGLRSSYGVLGSWTTIFHDADDPVGPFWLRKA